MLPPEALRQGAGGVPQPEAALVAPLVALFDDLVDSMATSVAQADARRKLTRLFLSGDRLSLHGFVAAFAGKGEAPSDLKGTSPFPAGLGLCRH